MNNETKKNIDILIRKFKFGKFREVINETIILLKKDNNDYLWNILGLCHQNLNSFEKSIECFNNAININPQNFAAINNIGISYKKLKKYTQSEEYLKKVLLKNPNYINALVNLGNLKNETYFFDEALKYYNKALNLDKNNFSLYLNIANIYEINNEIDQAKEYLNKSLKINPSFTKADHKLSLLQNYKKKENEQHLTEMLNKLDNDLINDYEKINLYFALAKAYEDNEDYAKSIKYLMEGNKLQRRFLSYKISFHQNLSEQIKLLFNNLNLKDFEKKENNQKRIFVLGMPRSGTTLVEQILSSHSQTCSISESNFLPEKILKNIYNKNKEEISNFLNSNINDEYTEFLKSFNIDHKIIIDKTLQNFWFIGFILIYFPNCKIIHVHRNPKDNCLSIFKNLFDTPEGWCYDQDELAQYYLLYKDIIKFWNNMFPGKIFNLNYENLINDQENEIKKLIEYCQLDWEQQCLKFYENKNPIKTLSVNQANKPMYKSSINKSKYYETNLDNLFSKLN